MGNGFRFQLGQILGTSGANGETCKEANQLLQSMLSKQVVPVVVPVVVLAVLCGVGVIGHCPHGGRVSGASGSA